MGNTKVIDWEDIRKQRRMKNITVNLQIPLIDLMGKMLEAGIYVSRSEFVRNAIADKLNKDITLIQAILNEEVDAEVWNKK